VVQANKVKAAFVLAAIITNAQAEPWVLPTLDGTEGISTPGAVRPAPEPLDARRIWDAALQCWPARSYFRGELSAVARVNNVNTTTLTETGVTTSRSYVGLVASIPLYSATEIDRERDREYRRRVDAAKVVEELIASTTKVHTTEREVELFRALERRAQERVRYGVADSTEQVAALKALAEAEGRLAEQRGKAIAAKLAAEATCEPAKAHYVRDALK
jgi:hypothetical protein